MSYKPPSMRNKVLPSVRENSTSFKNKVVPEVKQIDLSEAAFHHPDLTVSYAFVIVKLMNHAVKGVTNKDFELARKIEEIIMWQPGKEEGSALEGTPEDPRFKYIKYD